MPQVARLIGGAGTGKTTELLRIMDGVLQRVHDPFNIGFVSFTRAARREASNRAGDAFNVKPQKLENDGWFRTLHSVCFKQLGVARNEMISDDVESQAWIAEALGEEVHDTSESPDLADVFHGATTDSDKALAIWGQARNRLESLETAWLRAVGVDRRCPDYEDIEATVKRYEQAKRLDGRIDFTDILARYAGWYCTTDGAEPCDPDGEVPDVPCWFFDEAQDNSALTDAVARRLISHDGCEFAYVVGDYFQSIYSFGGASPTHFMGWPVAKERTMPKSYRCPPAIHDVGEEILRECSDYWDRGIQAADHEGDVEASLMGKRIAHEVDPNESWLLLARTNLLARKWGRLLDASGVPWTPTRGNGGWAAPSRNAATRALMALQAGAPISGGDWCEILKFAPSRYQDEQIIERGTKIEWKSYNAEDMADEYPWLVPEDLGMVGATPEFYSHVKAGDWYRWIPKSAEYADAVAKWGDEAIQAGKVKVGTIHSVKGSEADNVAVLTSLTHQSVASMKTDEGRDEEHRVWYVAGTRAKKRLIWVRENARYRKKVPT